MTRTLTLEAYVRLDRAGLITRPLSLGFRAIVGAPSGRVQPAATRTTAAERALLEGASPRCEDPRPRTVAR